MAWDDRGYLLQNYIRPGTPVDKSTIQEMDSIVSTPKNEYQQTIDVNWVRTRYAITEKEMSDARLKNGRYFTTASYKWSSTKMGCHLACNPKPQYTRYADIKPRYNTITTNQRVTTQQRKTDAPYNMGRYYSEAIDDNAQLVYMTFGIPKFNSLFGFLMGAIDYEQQAIANKGKPPFLYKTGEFIGAGLAFMALPITSVLIYGYKFAKTILVGDTSLDYYYMQPAMHSYWSTVNIILKQFCTELGLISGTIEDKETNPNRAIGMQYTVTEEQMKELSELIGGDILDPKHGYIDAYALASRPQRKYNEFIKKRKELLEAGETPIVDNKGNLLAPESINTNTIGSSFDMLADEHISFNQYLDKNVRNNPLWAKDADSKEKDETIPDASQVVDDAGNIIAPDGTMVTTPEELSTQSADTHQRVDNNGISKWLGKFFNNIQAQAQNGGDVAIFQVEYTGEATDSFSSSTGEIQTSGALKSVSTGARNVKFSFAGGSVIPGADEALAMAKDAAMGLINGATFGLGNVLTTIFGDAFLDIPKIWTDSNASLNSATYTIKLRSPYGNAISQIQNLYVPLSMLLAGALPLSTGPASYTSPFLCSLNCQGVSNIKMGIITELTITRGVTNLPYTKDRKPLGIDISFRVTDLSNVVSAPISRSVFDRVFNPPSEDASLFARYVGTVAGRDFQTFKYFRQKLSRRLSIIRSNMKQRWSPYYLSSALMDSGLYQIISPFADQGAFNPGGMKSI